jgi:alpha-galactosidase
VIFPAAGDGTRLVLDAETEPERLPVVRWIGTGDVDEAAARQLPGVPLLLEHSRGSYLRPGLRGSRTGRDWSTAFVPRGVEASEAALVVSAVDESAGLELRTELEALVGGALRMRHVLTNSASAPYQLEGLEVSLPVSDRCTEVLDFTGRHEGERSPQRHPVVDGLWLRETRNGRPGLDAPTLLVVGEPGFGFARGELLALAVAHSGNAVLAEQRSGGEPACVVGGELLLPGEVVLEPGGSYATPWVVIVAADGLDAGAAALHDWQRSLPAHPDEQPVTLNVWEAVYFDHDFDRLRQLAERAARIGVERFVLDDGWFNGRRDDTAGLGDWYVDPAIWPNGLTPLIDTVHALGMQFGLWFEPEMVNPDSDLYRAHPDWILSTGGRVPLLQRNQLVLDLTNPDVWRYLHDRMDALLSEYRVDYVKWDHNRDLLDAGSPLREGAPAVHEQTAAFTRLLVALRARHPSVAFESCASGGGRIDLEVVEQVQRVWTSDLTDALARQRIQRWTAQLLAPEYLGAHVSAPTSHQTGRTFSLDFRAATALFGAFGIEWDLTEAGEEDLDRLAEWVALHKQWRPVLHAGRVVRVDVSDPSVLAHGVVSPDRTRALFAHVQLDEAASNRGVVLRLRGLDPAARYRCRWVGPVDDARVTHTVGVQPAGPTGGEPVTGAALGRVGVWIPRRRPEQILLIAVEAVDPDS